MLTVHVEFVKSMKSFPQNEFVVTSDESPIQFDPNDVGREVFTGEKIR